MVQRATTDFQKMHVHKMFKKLHKRRMMHHHGMEHHMVHGMHRMGHPKPFKAHEMGHHKKHHHKMHKKHHHMKHHRCSSSSSSSSSSSDSDSEEEGLVDGFCSINIDSNQSPKEKAACGDKAMTHGTEGGEMKWKMKCKKNKHLKLHGKHKKGKCKWSMIEKMIFLDAHHPGWRMNIRSVGRGPCRDRNYDKERFSLPPPEITPRTEESTAEDATPQQEAMSGVGLEGEIFIGSGPRCTRRFHKHGDNVDLFMQSIAEQVKKLSPQKIAQAKLKILETVNELQLEVVPGPSTEMGTEDVQQQAAELTTE